jgi:hypothetical protein
MTGIIRPGNNLEKMHFMDEPSFNMIYYTIFIA